MICKKRQTKGLTLMEIVVAAVLLALIMGGLANVFFAAKRWMVHSRLRMTGGELSKNFLDPLSVDVRQDEWSGSDYQAGNLLRTDTWTGSAVGVGGKSFTPSYDVGVVPPPGVGATSPPQMRKVTVDITWTED